MAPCPELDKGRYDQNKFLERCKHFFEITNPLNLFVSDEELEKAAQIVNYCRTKKKIPEGKTEEDLWRAKILYDSAYHPETGQKMNLIGRMSAQVPMNMLITGAMMTFYKTNMQVFFWQWVNQSFNALVNFTNRSGDAAFTNEQIAQSYVLATSGAVITAVGLNKMLRRAPPVVKRMVPFFAVFAANCINIPLMRSEELKNGTTIYDENNKKIGSSKVAAQHGISEVIVSRVFMAVPGMLFTPFLMNSLERKGVLKRMPWITLPLQIGLVGFCLSISTPTGCALFKQYADIKYNDLEPELKHLFSCYIVFSPFAMNYLERRGTLCRYPWINLPTQTGLLGLCLIFATPVGCALYKQNQSLCFTQLEQEAKEDLCKRLKTVPDVVYFNKGL